MRIEYKYLVPAENLNKLRNALSPFIEHDAFALERPDKEYTVRSIYLDTPRLDYYYEKIEGVKIRKKLRIRGYNEFHGERLVFLEIKRKNGSHSFKNRSPLLYGDLPLLFETGNIEEFVLTNKKNDNPLKDGKRFFYHYFKYSLRPSVLVVYDREAYFVKSNPRIRITLDKDLRFLASPTLIDLYDEANLRYALPGRFVLEVKFDHNLPLWLRDVIRKYDLKRCAVSKYAICLDAHHQINKVEKFIKKSYLNNILETDHHLKRIEKDASRFSKYS